MTDDIAIYMINIIYMCTKYPSDNKINHRVVILFIGKKVYAKISTKQFIWVRGPGSKWAHMTQRKNKSKLTSLYSMYLINEPELI